MSCFCLFLQPTKKHESSNPADAGTQHKTPGKTSHSPDKQEDSKDDDSGKDGEDKEDGGDEGEQEEEEEEKKPEIEARPPGLHGSTAAVASFWNRASSSSLAQGNLPCCCIIWAWGGGRL